LAGARASAPQASKRQPAEQAASSGAAGFASLRRTGRVRIMSPLCALALGPHVLALRLYITKLCKPAPRALTIAVRAPARARATLQLRQLAERVTMHRAASVARESSGTAHVRGGRLELRAIGEHHGGESVKPSGADARILALLQKRDPSIEPENSRLGFEADLRSEFAGLLRLKKEAAASYRLEVVGEWRKGLIHAD
jgi:hypothetical protein